MDATHLAAIVGLLIALSVASERLVEIIKGLVPFLNEKAETPGQEGLRRAVLQALAVVAGVVTAFLARPAIPEGMVPVTNTAALVALGLLASGGSGFWNAVLTYVLQVKDLNELLVKEKKTGVKAMERTFAKTSTL